MTKSSAQDTPKRLIDAALETLREEGFAGATSRAIARRGGFNQALVFYHFGSVDGLLLAALDATSEERLARYRAEVAAVASLDELIALMSRIYAEDRDSGHLTVVSQMIAGSLARRDLAPQVLARMEPWLALAEETVTRFLGASVARELAPALVTFYLGVNLLSVLDQGRIDALFARLPELAPLVAALTPPSLD
jgi:AcrR family transcriptional regulator